MSKSVSQDDSQGEKILGATSTITLKEAIVTGSPATVISVRRPLLTSRGEQLLQ